MIAIVLTTIIIFTSCFTGVENTAKITIGRNDRKEFQKSPEVLFLESLRLPTVAEWKPGKEFCVIDSKVSKLFDPRSLGADATDKYGLIPQGTLLKFVGLDSVIQADGRFSGVMLFDYNNNICRYPINKRVEDVKNLTIRAFPMLSDMDVIADANAMFKGKELFTKTVLWYDEAGNDLKGRKFVKVVVDTVVPGDMIFPLLVKFHTTDNVNASMLMNFGYMPNESRSFDALFSLTDIHKNYPGIKEDIWQLITQCRVRNGMTKDECRLSLGNPSEVDRGHTWSQSLDIWKYNDGKYLRFADGILIDYK